MQRNGYDIDLPPPKRQKRAERTERDDIVIDMPSIELNDKPVPILEPRPSIQPPAKKKRNLSQRYLLRYINLYLAVRHFWDDKYDETIVDETGYCHGLTLTWAAKMADYAEHEKFYQIKEAIVACPYECDLSLPLDDDSFALQTLLTYDHVFQSAYRHWFDDITLPLEKFLAQIEWAQNSKRYTQMGDVIPQTAANRILEITNQQYRIHDGGYTVSQLKKLIAQSPSPNGRFLVLSGGGKWRDEEKDNQIIRQHYQHTVGIFMRDSQCFFYDANQVDGQARYCESTDIVLQYLMTALYTTFNYPIPQIHRLQIKEILFQNVNDHKSDAIKGVQPLKIVIRKSGLPNGGLSVERPSESSTQSMNPFSYLLRRGFSLFGNRSDNQPSTQATSDESAKTNHKLKQE